jgi:peptidoglycan/LPS O-acetylase OafA/YrhL
MSGRFHSLDAMRGIAAIAVVVFHVSWVLHLDAWPQSYLAVDFFFALSGFVLAHAYEDKLKTSLSAWRFIKMRIIRLYPLFALGIAFGAIVTMARIIILGPGDMRPIDAVLTFVPNSIMLPAFNTHAPFELFPFNLPDWSLFFELFINIIFAWLLFRLSSAAVSAFCGAAAVACLYGVFLIGNANGGAWWPTATLGLLRVCFSFPLGVLFARAYRSRLRQRSPIAILIIAGLAVALLAVVPGRFAWTYDSVAIFLLLPLLLWFGATNELPKSFEKVSAILGDVSYPLYALHFPLLQIFAYIFARKQQLPLIPMAIAFIAGAFVFSWILELYFDAPVRKWLSTTQQLPMSAHPSVVRAI